MSTTIKCDNGDLIVGTSGRFILVDGIEKCAQDIAESLLNNWDENEDQYYNGSELFLLLRDQNSVLAGIAVEERIRNAVEEAVFRLMDMQEADDYVDEDELIEQIRELWVQRLGVDGSYAFFLRVITMSELELPMNFDLTLNQMLPQGVERVEDSLSFNPANQGRNESVY